MTALRGPTLGLLAALSLAATPAVLRAVPAEYADVPLACYITGAIAFALPDQPVLAGIFAGLAAWTKDEVLVFLAVFLAATALFRRRGALSAVAGALPAIAVVALFKNVLSRGNPSLLSYTSVAGATHRLVDVGRYGSVIAAFGREFLAMGSGWYHPILPLALLAVALRFDWHNSGARWPMPASSWQPCWPVTPSYTSSQPMTSPGSWRLPWGVCWCRPGPVLVRAGFVGLRAPEAAAIVKVAPPAKARKQAAR